MAKRTYEVSAFALVPIGTLVEAESPEEAIRLALARPLPLVNGCHLDVEVLSFGKASEVWTTEGLEPLLEIDEQNPPVDCG